MLPIALFREEEFHVSGYDDEQRALGIICTVVCSAEVNRIVVAAEAIQTGQTASAVASELPVGGFVKDVRHMKEVLVPADTTAVVVSE